ncbi:fatty acid synthase-like [Topomyia yanbarensis]|uniref:fatty acid synthase-like n=1 Tax=Topomyia yanbarensis TaxID=2498891 RepID=UPI00273A8765|nr:fatty acid synthase-like [Topomyia yanbarensis]
MATAGIGSVKLDECVVLSGISGRFPQSNNLRELASNLYRKCDMVDDKPTRWVHTMSELPPRIGKVNNLEKFDGEFFGYDRNYYHVMDPQLRLLLEHVHEAILDAGVNPETIRGSRTGVFVGVCFSETESKMIFQACPPKGYALLGCAKSQLANRISYVFDFHGPSLIVDTACSSSMYALDIARRSILAGQCDSAIVAGCNLCLHPYISYQFNLLGVLARSGVCRPFDEKASGYTRAEAVCAVLLQKAPDAKRIYAHVLHSKTNCDGFKSEGITYPSGAMQGQLMKELYQELAINPADISYIEAHSTGTVVGDPEECLAIDKLFCTNRDRPLPIGSIKSNIGHSEATAGIASIAKGIITLENGMIPPNINISTPRQDISALAEGRLQVVTDPQPLEGSLIALNSFGFGGANAHALIRSHMKHKIHHGVPQDDLPRLVVWSGRTKEAIDVMFDDISQRALDAEFISLLYNIQSHHIPGHRYRGFGIFSKQETESVKLELFERTRIKLDSLPLVLMFTGINTYWREDLETFRLFPEVQATVGKCSSVLNELGYDLFQRTDSKIDLLQLMVGSTVLQLAYVDLLNAIGVKYAAYGGYSVGQLTCAYLDQCLSLEQVIKLVHSHGTIFAEYNTKINFNAFLELGAKRPAPPLSFDAFIQNQILSRFGVVGGPLNPICAVVDQLKSRGLVAELLPFISLLYSKDSAGEISEKLKKGYWGAVNIPVTASSKWFNANSTAMFGSTSTHDSIAIVELLEKIPEHCLLLEAFSKRSIDPVLVSLKRNSKCVPVDYKMTSFVMRFLSALGHLYLSKQDLSLLKLYPPVEFPVSRATPMIAPLIRWDHRDSWTVIRYEWNASKASNIMQFKVSLSDAIFSYVTGHCIDGRVLFPATGYLSLVWELLTYLGQREMTDCPVQFDNVEFLRATSIAQTQSVTLTVSLQRATGRFEVLEGDTAVVVGYGRQLDDNYEHFTAQETPSSATILASRDFYKELRLRGYQYRQLFRSVLEARSDGSVAKIQWNGNWVAFLDSMIQVGVIGIDTRLLMVPTMIESVTICPKYHLSLISRNTEDRDYFISSTCRLTNVITSGGVRISRPRAHIVNRRNPPGIPILEAYRFVPYISAEKVSALEAVRMCVQLAVENAPSLSMLATELYQDGSAPFLPLFAEAMAGIPLIQPTLTLLSSAEMEIPNVTVKNEKLGGQTNLQFLISHDQLDNADFLKDALTSLAVTGYLVIRSKCETLKLPPQLIKIASFEIDEDQTIFVLQQTSSVVKESPAVIRVKSDDTSFNWLQELKDAIKIRPVLVYSQNDPSSGIIGLVNCIRKELKPHSIICVLIDDPSAPPFDLSHPFYKQQICLNLAINVYRNGAWGSQRHALLDLQPRTVPVSNHCYANCMNRSDLSSMAWFTGAMNASPVKGELVRVVYSALNFRDVMLATGRITSDAFNVNRLELECLLGNEYSGVTVNGRRVMGVVPCGAMSTLIECDPQMTWTIPDHWSLEDAATVPLVYGTVYTALFISSHIRAGKSILIHAGSGGVGLAAIQVCLANGLEVFTTVSTAEKKQFLLERYPRLIAENIGNSRDTSFEQMVKLRTNGKGVDYVLNSLAEEKLQASVRCLGRNGHFLEIGKYDMTKDSKLAMSLFQKGLTFTAVMLDGLFKGSEQEKQKIKELLTEGIISGVIQPLNTTVYPAVEIEKAFRFLASGKHMGKVLLRIREDDYDEQTLPIPCAPRLYCNPVCTYLIVGGLGGFGLELADWLVLRGCRKLVLSSSRGITKPYQEYRIRVWHSYGVQTIVSTDDVCSLEGCRKLIQVASELGPVAAIFNLAVQLRDCLLENQTVEKFVECFAPKAYATQFLDEVSRQLCPKLNYFVVFSSVSCGRGNAGQCNYGMANSVMERIVEKRMADGFPGKAIQWGAIGDVGIVADMAEDKLDMEIGGTLQQRITSCLQELDRLLECKDPVVASMVVAEKRLGGGSRNLIEAVMNIMSIRDLKSVSMESTLADIGMDSLMAVEIKQVLERDFDLVLSPQELRTLTFMKLQKMADEKNTVNEGFEKKFVIGMDMLLRNFGDEEYSGETVLQVLSNSTVGRPILLIPGMEGVAGNVLRTLASRLNAPVYILQTLNTAELNSIPAIVDHIMDELDEKLFNGANDYLIVAYSFGSFIALEIAGRLESRNLPGKLILIDGAPKFLTKLSHLLLGENPPDELIQKSLIAAIISVVFPNQPAMQVFSILEVPTFQEQIEKLIEVGKENKIYSPEYIRKVTTLVYNRLKMVFIKPEEKEKWLQVPIVLIRPSEVSTVDIEEDYGLESCTTEPVTLKIVEGSHMTMLESEVLIEIINSELA